jgi:hypothetical protein
MAERDPELLKKLRQKIRSKSNSRKTRETVQENKSEEVRENIVSESSTPDLNNINIRDMMNKINSDKKMKKRVKNMAKKMTQKGGANSNDLSNIDFGKFIEFMGNSGIMNQFKEIVENSQLQEERIYVSDEELTEDENEIDKNEIESDSDNESDMNEKVII